MDILTDAQTSVSIFSFSKSTTYESKMKHIIVLLLSQAIYGMLHSQNLVPNPSFEEHKTCDFIMSAIDTSFYNNGSLRNYAAILPRL
jgi:hypothetical protein